MQRKKKFADFDFLISCLVSFIDGLAWLRLKFLDLGHLTGRMRDPSQINPQEIQLFQGCLPYLGDFQGFQVLLGFSVLSDICDSIFYTNTLRANS